MKGTIAMLKGKLPSRDEAMDKLAVAIIREVFSHVNGCLPEEQDESPALKVAISNRIKGWLNHELGLVPLDSMSQQAYRNNQATGEQQSPVYCAGEF